MIFQNKNISLSVTPRTRIWLLYIEDYIEVKYGRGLFQLPDASDAAAAAAANTVDNDSISPEPTFNIFFTVNIPVMVVSRQRTVALIKNFGGGQSTNSSTVQSTGKLYTGARMH